ncbi:hypothetical protein ACFWZT_01390 [Streptomyces alboflavus]|uniref:hypothetical protein n=1 Tax=Streptomyces alboflavus TaxID=67267 RepID=UPI0036B72407
MRLPDEQLRAGHIPADLARQMPPGTDLRKVVIVQEAPRNYTGPIVLTLVITAGSALVLLVLILVVQAVAASAIAVLSATCGIGISLNRASKGRAHTPRKRPARRRTTRSKHRK